MNLTFCKKMALGATLLAFAACGDINSSWEVKGGGYVKYKVNGEGPYTIELAKDDAHVTSYTRGYFQLTTRLDESDRGDQISLMVNNPMIGTELAPVSRASLNGRFQYVTWMREEYSPEAPIIADSSYVKFDERSDSLWSADLDLYFKDCRSGTCPDSLPPLHITGRLRYWVPDSER